MSTVHFLNVGKGDCTLIQHASGRNSLIDVSKGNYVPPVEERLNTNQLFAKALEEASASTRGDFGMSKKPTNPITYLGEIGISDIFRFILTHPDMDHMDGLDALLESLNVVNYWDSGVRKQKPEFSESGPYKEEDWDRYSAVLVGKEEGLNVLTKRAGSRFPHANLTEAKEAGGDGLYILAPDKNLVDAVKDDEDVNDASYVLLYRSPGGRILIPGDAHDETWDYVIKNYKTDVENCSILFAPHHGRKSGRSFEFLDVVKPKMTFFGCASSGHLAYQAWNSRKLPVVTNNQAGNIVLECEGDEIHVFVQNEKFAKASGRDMRIKNAQGYIHYSSIKETAEIKP
jgi:beta-lactamase superfamily II metal-dependent hydrolase